MLPLDSDLNFGVTLHAPCCISLQEYEVAWFKSLIHPLHGRVLKWRFLLSIFLLFYFSFRSDQGTPGLCGRQVLHSWQGSSKYPVQTLLNHSKDMWNCRLIRPWWVKIWYIIDEQYHVYHVSNLSVSGTCIKQLKPLSLVCGFFGVNILHQIRNSLSKQIFWSP